MDALMNAFYRQQPDPTNKAQQVSFGTSGHRGSALNKTFNRAHIAVICQAVADYRQLHTITGPLFLGLDTHALSQPAWEVALQVLCANHIDVRIQPNNGVTATPLISRAILQHNHCRDDGHADGLIITPSHNPPEDGGIKYNTPDGGPADGQVTGWIQARANEYLMRALQGVHDMPLAAALKTTHEYDYVGHFVEQLPDVIDMAAIQNANLVLGVDPMGGTALPVWLAIAERYALNLTITNHSQDSSFAFMPPDHDGKIRMDCSSRAAMANLLTIKDRFQLAFANDPDADRHGIVDADGLLNPNHYLAVCIDYVLQHRPQWSDKLAIGKTLVSSSMIDRVVNGHQRTLYEVPVGFKWFVKGLHDGELAFGGEESAGASLLTRDGQPWSTDKDGIVLALLAAEILAVTGKTPHQYYADLVSRHGQPHYRRIDAPCDDQAKAAFASLNETSIHSTQLAGEPIRQILLHAPGNHASIGGIKVVTDNGWFAARPSGTEALYKIYAESFISAEHLQTLLDEAQCIIDQALIRG